MDKIISKQSALRKIVKYNFLKLYQHRIDEAREAIEYGFEGEVNPNLLHRLANLFWISYVGKN